jgi:hypothetical protein
MAFRFVSKAKRHAPLSIRRAEPEFLHIRVPRALEGIHTRSGQLRPKLLQEPRHGEDLILHVFVESIEFRFELLTDLDCPGHFLSMTLIPYGSEAISPGWHRGTPGLRARRTGWSSPGNSRQDPQRSCRV